MPNLKVLFVHHSSIVPIILKFYRCPNMEISMINAICIQIDEMLVYVCLHACANTESMRVRER